MTTKANKPVTIAADLYNDLVGFFGSLDERRDNVPTNLLGRLRMTLDDDGCIDGDGSGLCETHNYLPIEYYTSDIERTLPLKYGTFDREEEGFPVCPDAQTYSDDAARSAQAI